MKVVINKCFGGFGVSPDCLWELIRLGYKGVEVDDIGDYFGANNPTFADTAPQREREQLDRARQWWIEHPKGDHAEFVRGLPAGWVLDYFGNTLYDTVARKVYSYDRGNQFIDGSIHKSRCDSDLIRLIEERGSEWASGKFAKLKVVEVPDGVPWEIDEYNGQESVHETHQVWG